jgi:hypothetical protein
MDEISALIAIAEIAAALAGFSGVATALAQRGDAEFWSPGQRSRFVDLLTHSGIALFTSLVPMVSIYRIGDGPTARVWVVASLIWAFFASFGVTAGIVRQRRFPAATSLEAFVSVLALTIFVGLLLLQLGNAIWIREFWPYLAALVGNLAFAFVQFMRLVIPRLAEGQ